MFECVYCDARMPAEKVADTVCDGSPDGDHYEEPIMAPDPRTLSGLAWDPWD